MKILTILMLFIAVAASATAYQFPLWIGFDDNSGDQLISGEVTVYDHGTTTLSTLYDDKDESNPVSNPYTTNAYGRAEIYARPGYYDVVMKDNDGVTLETFLGGFRVGPADDYTSNNQDVLTLSPTNAAGGGLKLNSASTDDYRLEISTADNGFSITNTTDALKEMIFQGDGNVIFADGKEVKADEFRARDGDGVRLYDDGNNGLYIADGGAATFTHALTLSTTLSCAGAAQFQSTVGITGAVTLDSTLSIAGNVDIDGGAFVFNESGADKDLRCESDSNSAMFFIDASANSIGLNTDTPEADVLLHVKTGDSGADPIHISDGAVLIEDNLYSQIYMLGGIGSSITMGDATDRIYTQVVSSSSSGFDIVIDNGNISAFHADSIEIVINNGSDNVDFRVEGDTMANCFKVDAGNDQVTIDSTDITWLGSAYTFNTDNGTRHFYIDGNILNHAFEFDPTIDSGFGGLLLRGGTGNDPTCALDVNDDYIRIRSSKTPSSTGDTGDQGSIAWDTNYIYVCVGANSWGRATLEVGGW